MNKFFYTVITAIVFSSLLCGYTNAAPNIDGIMEEWNQGGYAYIAAVGGESGGSAYDLEEMGLFIDDGMLYFAIQGGFDLENGIAVNDNRYDVVGASNVVNAGDFAFSFNNGATWDVGVHYDINGSNVDLTVHWGDLIWGNAVDFDVRSPFAVLSSLNQEHVSNAGIFKNVTANSGNTLDDGYTIEAAINLNTLSNDLAMLFNNNISGVDQVMMHYTMECGNDLLEVSQTYEYSETPEPATFILFGIGLLGFGVIGRRKKEK